MAGSLKEIAAFLDRELDIESFTDRSANGLQVRYDRIARGRSALALLKRCETGGPSSIAALLDVMVVLRKAL